MSRITKSKDPVARSKENGIMKEENQENQKETKMTYSWKIVVTVS
jgi:hypothetical protein